MVVRSRVALLAVGALALSACVNAPSAEGSDPQTARAPVALEAINQSAREDVTSALRVRRSASRRDPGHRRTPFQPATLPPQGAGRRVPGAQDPVAVRLSNLAEQRVLRLDLDGAPVVLFAAPRLASALDADTVAGGREVAATGAFSPIVDGDELIFAAEGGALVDRSTGTTWDLLGRAVDGPLAGRQPERVPHVDTFWFAWAAFRPDARLIEPT